MYNLPLNKFNGIPSVNLNTIQKKALQEFVLKVEAGELKFIENDCLCGNKDRSFDVLVAEQDRYGIFCENILCKKCSLIRQKHILDDRSTYVFYSQYYRSIYGGNPTSSDVFFKNQVNMGLVFIEFLSKEINLKEVNTVFELGCGAGGILFPFNELNKQASGCDFGEEYLQYGINKGLQLYPGGLDKQKTPPNSQDLLILSHVVEHFNEPVKELNQLIDVVKEGGYLLIEVPSSLSLAKNYVNPILYFQNAHISNFNKKFLNLFFTHLGLEVIKGNERCTFILKKPFGWEPNTEAFQVIEEMSLVADRLEKYLKLHKLLCFLQVSPYLYRRRIISLLIFLKLKPFVKKLLS